MPLTTAITIFMIIITIIIKVAKIARIIVIILRFEMAKTIIIVIMEY